MPRARLLKPGFFANEELAECTPMARLMFAGLWTIADREGRLEDRPKRIKAELFPYEDVDADALLDELAGRGFILRYSNGGRFIAILSFPKHQSPHMREPKSTIPEPELAPDEHQTSTVPAPDAHSAATAFSGTSPAVTGSGSGNQLAVSGDPVAESVAVAVSTGDDTPGDDDGIDSGFRDRYGTMAVAFGGRLDRRLADEFEQAATELTIDEITEAIAKCRSENVRCWPREIRARVPKPKGDDFAARKAKYVGPLTQRATAAKAGSP